MSQVPPMASPANAAGGPLGVTEAIRLGWRLLTGDFWQILVAALVVVAILGGIKVFPCISCLAPVIMIFIWPPLMAGLFWVIAKRIDGLPIDVGALFRGFHEGYGQIIVAGLPVTLTAVAVGIISFGVRMGLSFAVVMWDGLRGGEMSPLTMLSMYGFELLVVVIQGIIVGIVGLFFMFALLAVWETPGDGWGAVKRSVRVVASHWASALGFGLIFGLLWLAAWIAGLIACCVGWFFTMAVFQGWHAASVVYLYRAWTGHALVQSVRFPWEVDEPAAAAPPGEPPPSLGDVGPPQGA